jgi:hypothetical protein
MPRSGRGIPPAAARTAAGGDRKSWATCGLRRGSGVESRGQAVGVLLGHLVDLGFMGLNGSVHDFSFSFLQLLKLQINIKCTQI